MEEIFGFLEAFEAALKKTDLSGKNQLILLGDYIDYGPDGRAMLEKVRALQEKYGSEKVIALMGNHEKALLDLQYRRTEKYRLRLATFAWNCRPYHPCGRSYNYFCLRWNCS